MAYRSETERLRRENDELRAELEAVEARLRALHSHSDGSPTWVRRLLGTTTDVSVSRRVPGTLSVEVQADVQAALARRFDAQGEVVAIGHRFSWASPRGIERSNNVDVSMSEDEGTVAVTVHTRPARLGVVAYALIVGMVLPFLFATLSALSHLPSLLIIAPFLLAALFLARVAFVLWGRAGERRARATLDELASLVERSQPERARIATDHVEARIEDADAAAVEEAAEAEALSDAHSRTERVCASGTLSDS